MLFPDHGIVQTIGGNNLESLFQHTTYAFFPALSTILLSWSITVTLFAAKIKDIRSVALLQLSLYRTTLALGAA
jgi:hypothetical protein